MCSCHVRRWHARVKGYRPPRRATCAGPGRVGNAPLRASDQVRSSSSDTCLGRSSAEFASSSSGQSLPQDVRRASSAAAAAAGSGCEAHLAERSPVRATLVATLEATLEATPLPHDDERTGSRPDACCWAPCLATRAPPAPLAHVDVLHQGVARPEAARSSRCAVPDGKCGRQRDAPCPCTSLLPPEAPPRAGCAATRRNGN